MKLAFECFALPSRFILGFSSFFSSRESISFLNCLKITPIRTGAWKNEWVSIEYVTVYTETPTLVFFLETFDSALENNTVTATGPLPDVVVAHGRSGHIAEIFVPFQRSQSCLS